MTDEQAVLVMAAIIWTAKTDDPAEARGPKEALEIAREFFAENYKLGPLRKGCDWCGGTKTMFKEGKPIECPKCTTRKATLSHPTIQERNEAHAERQFNKRRGT